MAFSCVRVQFEIGHEASVRSVRTSEGYTHNWEVFVRGVDNAEIHNFVEKVVFHLHNSFPSPKRTKKDPPYVVSESGYAGFNLPIDIYFKTKDDNKKLRYYYDLTFPIQQESVSNIIKHKAEFANPSEDFRRKLIKGGGIGVGGNEGKVSEKTHSGNEDSKHSSKNKSSTASDNKKHKSKDLTKVEEFKTKNSFADLFGTPIKTISPGVTKPIVKPSSNDSGKSTHIPEKQVKEQHNAVKTVKPSPSKDKDGSKKENFQKKEKDSSKDKEKDRERSSKGDNKSKEKEKHREKEFHKIKEKDKSKHVKRSCSPNIKNTSSSGKEDVQKKIEEPKDKVSSSKIETKSKHKEKRKDKEEKKPHKEEKKETKDRTIIDKLEKNITVEHKKSEPVNEKKDFISESKPEVKAKSSIKEERKERSTEKEKEKSENSKHRHKHKKKERHKKDEKEKHKKKHERAEDTKVEPESLEPVKPVHPLKLLEHSLSDKDSDTDFSMTEDIVPSERSASESPPSPTPAPPAPVTLPSVKVKEEKKPVEVKEEKHKRHDKKSKDEKESRKRKKKVKGKEDQPPEKIPKTEPKIEPKVEVKDEDGDEEEEEDLADEDTSKSPERSSEVSKSPSPEGNKFTDEYVLQLRELQHKIMSLQDTSYLQKVVEVIAETGQFEITQRTFDFDLCALDRVTVKRLQDMFVTAS